MSCLAHDLRYSSAFHAVINELRETKSLSAQTLRTMPRACCTCHADQLIEKAIASENRERFLKLKHLAERIERDQAASPKLIQSLNLLENSIPMSNMTTAMEIGEEKKSSTGPQTKGKSVQTGTFLFLPYCCSKSPYPEDQKTKQRGRFISRMGHIPLLEKEHHVCINMVTRDTSDPVRKALEQAKTGSKNFRVHSPKSETKEEGEWILIRAKTTSKKEARVQDFQAVLDALTNRWESCLTIKKRKLEDDWKEYFSVIPSVNTNSNCSRIKIDRSRRGFRSAREDSDAVLCLLRQAGIPLRLHPEHSSLDDREDANQYERGRETSRVKQFFSRSSRHWRERHSSIERFTHSHFFRGNPIMSDEQHNAMGPVMVGADDRARFSLIYAFRTPHRKSKRSGRKCSSVVQRLIPSSLANEPRWSIRRSILSIGNITNTRNIDSSKSIERNISPIGSRSRPRLPGCSPSPNDLEWRNTPKNTWPTESITSSRSPSARVSTFTFVSTDIASTTNTIFTSCTNWSNTTWPPVFSPKVNTPKGSERSISSLPRWFIDLF